MSCSARFRGKDGKNYMWRTRKGRLEVRSPLESAGLADTEHALSSFCRRGAPKDHPSQFITNIDVTSSSLRYRGSLTLT